MHGETFADLLADLEDARDEWERALDRRLREMTDQLDGLI
jgi:polyhydroxyalkanoate synthesis regulator phasin